jgi:hypothetical protein
MKSMVIAGLAAVLACPLSLAQSSQWESLNSQEKQIMQVVIDVFDGMRAGDSAAVKKHFYPQVSANTTFTSKEGKKVLQVDDINNLFNAIAQPHDQVWDERIWDYQVDIDGNLTAVWVKYAFYLDDEFHHCGVDAIQLAHNGQVWRIFHIADTRQTDGCDIPAQIANGATY